MISIFFPKKNDSTGLTTLLILLITVVFIFAAPTPLKAETTGATVGTGTKLPLTSDEIKLIIQKPNLKIHIPGIDFTDPELVIKNTKEEIDKEGNKSTYLYIPYLGEYLATIYKYAIGIAVAFAIVMLINQGFGITMSGGKSEKISEAKKRLGEIITGLIIAIGSYVILYAINPELVQFKNLKVKYVRTLPLGFIDRGTLIESSISGKVPSGGLKSTIFDSLFQTYQPCLEVDWKVLKALAYQESRFVVKAVSSEGFGGLFQTKEPNCRGYLGDPYFLSDYCSNYTHPEVSTMVGVSSVRGAVQAFKKMCNFNKFEDLVFFINLYHQSGSGSANCVYSQMNRDCSYEKTYSLLYKCWMGVKKGDTEDIIVKKQTQDNEVCSTPKEARKSKKMPSRCAKEIADENKAGGQNVINFTHQLGANQTLINLPSNYKEFCPMFNHSLALKFKYDPNATNASTDIKCDSKYNGRKVLALGDSITANSNSYVEKLKAACPGINFSKIAKVGMTPGWMYDQIKDLNLKSAGYTDLTILGGINGIGRPAKTTEDELTNIYKKAKADGLRVIAINLNPSKGWWDLASGGPHMTDQTAIAKLFQNTTIVNQWISSQKGSLIDVVVDEYKILDSNNDYALDSIYDTGGDHLHYNALGHAAVAAELSKQAFQ